MNFEINKYLFIFFILILNYQSLFGNEQHQIKKKWKNQSDHNLKINDFKMGHDVKKNKKVKNSINNSINKTKTRLTNQKYIIGNNKKSTILRNKRRLRLRSVSARIGIKGLLDLGELKKGEFDINYDALNWVESHNFNESDSIEFLKK